ncbi:trehalase family glycosidase [Pseudoalteromonas sp. H105]|uniref:trehalase family glycosidase n=1 Tax=Pseudoalteromonas sp. H105 TaxID=1348393 RepID=UPI0007323FC8|nr:trehalase family glycosidase [Pseudoalteromonas sp. H105]KTF13058.1 alpha,alpha-trehalase [Pseudoalteromonas sp. H105]
MNFLQSQLFLDVQLAAIFDDSKTFSDAIAKQSWQAACEHYLQVRPLDKQQLTEFVAQHFTLESTDIALESSQSHNAKTYIAQLWPKLHRPADEVKSSSLLPLKHSYIVPGGRFQEIYYWDSYFTSLGLQDINDLDSIEAMLFNFIDLQARNGCIPNGNRLYYSSRSQPPVMALMVDLLWQAKYCQKADFKWLARCVEALEEEYAFWMIGSDLLSKQTPALRRIAQMECGARLNRYWDDVARPRPESLREDLEDAAVLPESQRARYYQHIRAACESGWDFSSRWLADSHSLISICTTDIIPVDLNCLLYNLENLLGRYCKVLNYNEKQHQYERLAALRLEAINRYLYDEKVGFYVDYNYGKACQSPVLSLASVVPLFVKCASDQQAQQVKTKLMTDFLKAGGLVTTLNETAQQWDSPNGWAPLHWFAVKGLQHYHFDDDAKIIMTRWLNTIESGFSKDGCLLEKYDVCNVNNRAGGGEYTVQQGFGWTNGVTSRFYQLLNK